MPIGLKEFVELTVPQNLLIVFISPIVAYSIINHSLPGFEIAIIIVSLAFAVLGFNSHNMIFDEYLDKIDKPNRPLPSGRVSVKEVSILSFFLFLFAFLISLFTNIGFIIILTIFFVISYSYSSHALRFKKYWWGSSFTGTFQYAIVPFMAAQTISHATMPLFFFLYVVITFAIISNIKDIEDIDGERKAKINSVPIMLGVNNTLALILVGPIILNLLLSLLVFSNILEGKYLYSIFASILFYLIFAFLIKKEIRDNYGNKNITTQSHAVTFITIAALLSQVSYAIIALL